MTKMKTLEQITTKKSPIKIWVGRMDEVHGDCLIAIGQSEKEVENLLYNKYKEVAKLGGYKLQKSKADFFHFFGGWIQTMEVGKAYIGPIIRFMDEDETPKG